jgi:hypothetical protein
MGGALRVVRFAMKGVRVHHASSASVLKKGLLTERLLGGLSGAVVLDPGKPPGAPVARFKLAMLVPCLY